MYQFRKIGLSIEGIIDDSPGLVDPTIIFTFRDHESSAENPQVRPWLVDFPGRIQMSINPSSGGVSAGACTLEVSRSGEFRGLFFRAGRGQPEISTDSAVDAITDMPGFHSLQDISDVRRLHLGDETIYAPAGFELAAGTDDLWIPVQPVIRGAGNSGAQEHPAGMKARVRPDYMRGRKIRAHIYDVDAAATSIHDATARYFLWSGQVEGWKTDRQQTKIQIRTTDPLAKLDAVRLGDGRLTYRPITQVIVSKSDGRTRIKGKFEPVVSEDAPYDESRHVRPDLDFIYLRINNTLVRGVRDDEGRVTLYIAQPRMGSEAPDVGILEVEECWEVLASNPKNNLSMEPFVSGVDSFEGIDDRYRTAEGIAYLLGSGADEDIDHPLGYTAPDNPLGTPWRAGADWSYVWPWLEGDTDKDPPVKFGEMDDIDQLLIGWDDPESAFDIIFRQILLPRGVAPCLQPMPHGLSMSMTSMESPTYSADPSAEKIGPVDIEITDDQITLDSARSQIKGAVEATVGETPWRAPRLERIKVRRGNRSDDEPDVQAYDFSTFNRFIGAYASSTSLEELRDKAEKARNPLPLINVTTQMGPMPLYGIEPDILASPPVAIYPGQLVRLINGPETGLIGADGEMVSPDILASREDVRWVGLVVSSTIAVEQFSQDLRVMLIGWQGLSSPSRLIAPAARVTELLDDDHLRISLEELQSIRVDSPIPAVKGDDVHTVLLVDDRGRRILPDDEARFARTDPEDTPTVLFSAGGELQPAGMSTELGSAIGRGLFVRLPDRDTVDNKGETDGEEPYPVVDTIFAYFSPIDLSEIFDLYL